MHPTAAAFATELVVPSRKLIGLKLHKDKMCSVVNDVFIIGWYLIGQIVFYLIGFVEFLFTNISTYNGNPGLPLQISALYRLLSIKDMSNIAPS